MQQTDSNPNTVLIDCHHAGISGDMMVGALIDLGADHAKIEEEIEHCTRDEGTIRMQVSKVMRASISCTKVDFEILRADHHIHMQSCLEKASDPWVKDRALKVLQTLEMAESRVHAKKDVEHPHLHEVGQLDAVADILGSLTAWRNLRLDRMKTFSTRVALGGGKVNFSHGDFPVPAPATLEILQGIPVSMGGNRELTTPTGASLLVNLADEFVERIDLSPVRIGLGAGSDVGNFLNATRVILGIRDGETHDLVDVIETSVDDVTPEALAYSGEKLMGEGALDVGILPSLMKKGRPGNLIRIVTPPETSDRICELLLAETGSLGARIYRGVERRKLKRETRSVTLELDGSAYEARLKVGMTIEGSIVSVKPEYVDVASICKQSGLKFPRVYRAILEAAAARGLTG